MTTGAKRGLGIAIAGVLAWFVALVGSNAVFDDGRTGGDALTLVFALVGAVGIAAVFGGLIYVAWSLIRSR